MTAEECRLHLFALAVASRLADAAEVLGRLAEKRSRVTTTPTPGARPMPATLKPPHADPAALAALEAACGLTAAEARGRVATLTPREREVFELMGRCERNRDIAAYLGISSKTLDIHRANVLRKLGEESAMGVPRHYYLLAISGRDGGE